MQSSEDAADDSDSEEEPASRSRNRPAPRSKAAAAAKKKKSARPSGRYFLDDAAEEGSESDDDPGDFDHEHKLPTQEKKAMCENKAWNSDYLKRLEEKYIHREQDDSDDDPEELDAPDDLYVDEGGLADLPTVTDQKLWMVPRFPSQY